MSTMNDYQQQAARTLNVTPRLSYDTLMAARRSTDDERTLKTAIMGLGIAGEAGEVADYLKKVLGHGHELDLTKLAKELGDVLWYVAALATMHGLKLDDIATTNINKLRERFPNGFTEADSIARLDEEIVVQCPRCTRVGPFKVTRKRLVEGSFCAQCWLGEGNKVPLEEVSRGA